MGLRAPGSELLFHDRVPPEGFSAVAHNRNKVDFPAPLVPIKSDIPVWNIFMYQGNKHNPTTVSYTHLTLPTIYSV